MKKIAIIITLVFSLNARAHNDPFLVQMNTTTLSTFSGQATFTGYLKAIDTLTLISGNQFKINFLDSVSVNQLNGGSLLLPGDSVTFQFTGTYDTATMPIYPVEQLIFKDVVTNHGDTIRAEFWVHLFFSPWGELEIFNHTDFKHCGRNWKNEENDTMTTRIYIPKYLIPNSTWQYPDTTSAEWEHIPQYTTLPGLPFYVMLAAAHPDTLQYYSDNFGDNLGGNSISIVSGTYFTDKSQNPYGNKIVKIISN
jgi:hypothetical protein